jgi:hypothetical protein
VSIKLPSPFDFRFGVGVGVGVGVGQGEVVDELLAAETRDSTGQSFRVSGVFGDAIIFDEAAPNSADV